jgi:hypothetical protein
MSVKIISCKFDNMDGNYLVMSVVGEDSWSDEVFDSIANDLLSDLVKDPEEWFMDDCWETT